MKNDRRKRLGQLHLWTNALAVLLKIVQFVLNVFSSDRKASNLLSGWGFVGLFIIRPVRWRLVIMSPWSGRRKIEAGPKEQLWNPNILDSGIRTIFARKQRGRSILHVCHRTDVSGALSGCIPMPNSPRQNPSSFSYDAENDSCQVLPEPYFTWNFANDFQALLSRREMSYFLNNIYKHHGGLFASEMSESWIQLESLQCFCFSENHVVFVRCICSMKMRCRNSLF